MQLLDMDSLAQGLQGFGHPIRIRALILLESEHSPSELAELLGDVPLGVVAYHVRMLRQYGLAAEARTAPKRGALEHFYQRTELAEVLMDTVGPLMGLARRDKRRTSATSNGARVEELLEVVKR